jgi:hypothetical protein
LLRRVATEVQTKGTYEAMENAPSLAELNRMME